MESGMRDGWESDFWPEEDNEIVVKIDSEDIAEIMLNMRREVPTFSLSFGTCSS
jgi:hypothetical protein